MIKRVALRDKVLLACVAERDWRVVPPELAELVGSLAAGEGLDGLIQAAKWHRVEGCVWLALRPLRDSWAESAPLAELERAYQAAVANHLRTMADLQLIGAAFVTAEIPFVVVKGPVLAEHVYARSDLRSYTDLDLLVTPAMLGTAAETLRGTGATMLDANWPMLQRRMVGEIHLSTARGVILDLHWSLLHDAPARASFRVPTQELLSRRQLLPIRGVEVPALSDTDAVVHLALHAAQSGADRLGWLKDVERAISVEAMDWDAVVKTTRDWHAEIAVATVLDRVRRAFGTPVPQEVRDAIAPPVLWRAVAASANRFSPVARPRPAGSASRIVARAARGASTTSLVELTRRSAAWAVHGHSRGPKQPLWDAADPLSAAYPAGSSTDFFAAVSEQGRRPQLDQSAPAGIRQPRSGRSS